MWVKNRCNGLEGYRISIAQQASCRPCSSGRRWPPELGTSPSYRPHWTSWSETTVLKMDINLTQKIQVKSFKCSVNSQVKSTNLPLITPRESHREQTVNVCRRERVILSDMFLRLECLQRQDQKQINHQEANVQCSERTLTMFNLVRICLPGHSPVSWRLRRVQVLSLRALLPAAGKIQWYEGTSHALPAQTVRTAAFNK